MQALSAVLTEARTLKPAVWCARLDEIADWWRARDRATIQIADVGDNGFHVTVTGPPGTTILIRAAEVDAPALPWADGYRQVETSTFTVRAPVRPFIGLWPGASTRNCRICCGSRAILSSLTQTATVIQSRPINRLWKIKKSNWWLRLKERRVP
jgi:hypothetical protein